MTPRPDAPAERPARLDQPKTLPGPGPDSQALLQAARRVYRSQSAADAVQALLAGVRSLGCTQASFYAAGRGEGELRLSAEAGLTADAAQTLPRAALDQPGAAAAAAWAAAPESSAAYPVSGARGTHGLLVCGWATRETCPPESAAALAELAADAGHALDRLGPAPLPDDAGAAFDAINAVTDIGLLYSNLIDRLLHAILEQILEAMGIGAGAIFLYDEQSSQLDLALSAAGSRLGADSEAALALWQPPALALCAAHADAAGRAGQSERVRVDEAGAVLADALAAAQMSELFSVPLLAGGWLTGVLQVVPLPGGTIPPAQLRGLGLVARQAAVAIENARLFAQARADQERTSAVVDATNDAILMLDERRRTMIINRRARFFFGLAERDLIGKDYDQISAIFGHIFADGQRFNSWLAQLLRSRTTRTVEEFRTARPESRLLQCFSAPVIDQHDRFLGRILVFRDITREREVDRMKNDFVAIVSHELRTPLTSIQGALQLILGQPALGRPGFTAGMSQRAVDLLTISLNNTARLIRLINDILDIAKIEQGRIQMRREPHEPAAICRSAADEVAALASGRDITIGLQLAEPLPPIYVDRDRAVQVLVNLLSNAIKFSSPSQRVLLSARRDGAMVHFAVRDWGRGIALEDQARLFQKFQQIDSSSTRDVGGTGLGLAISRALVEEHGGRMWLDSAPAAGSTFSFTLPIAEPARLSEESDPLVLLVADGPQEELCDALRAGGLRATLVEPAQSIELAQTLRPDVLLVELPAGPVGGELLRALRADPVTQTLPTLLIADEAEQPRETTLPRGSAPAAVVAAVKATLSAPRPLVLVVDDDPHVRPVLVRLLQRQGLRVSQASDGYSALEAAIRLRPQVILLDIKMPGIDGYEVLRRLRAAPATAEIKVIILTASDERTRVQARELQADDYLEKPIAVERLFGAISRVLARSEGRDG